MSNPFKTKKLEEFTIKDCESYLASYPYGEHHVEVNRRLKDLRSGRISAIDDPFETKTLAEFTIQDCQDYLKNNKRGKHVTEVIARLEELTPPIVDSMESINHCLSDSVKQEPYSNSTSSKVKKRATKTATVFENKDDIINVNVPSQENPKTPSMQVDWWDDVLKPLLSLIVVLGVISYFTGKPPKKSPTSTHFQVVCNTCEGSGYWPYLYWGLIKFDCASCKGKGYIQTVSLPFNH